jgi:hypothetical protein
MQNKTTDMHSMLNPSQAWSHANQTHTGNHAHSLLMYLFK